MPLTEVIQRIIYLLEMGAGSRAVRVAIVVLLFVLHCLWVDLRDYRNLSVPQAMDQAQVARNLAAGRGFTTEFIRPFSLFLVRQWNETQNGGQPAAADADFARLQHGHPDLANAPVYPLFLAGWMKVLPFNHEMEFSAPFWSEGGHFARDKSDVLIATINQLLLALVIWQSFILARKLFDPEVAWVTAILIFGCELLWDFSYSGLPTLLVLVIFLELTRRLVLFEEAARAEVPSHVRLTVMAVTAGVLAGVGGLTQYAFGWVILPVMVFLLGTGGIRRWTYALSAAGAFLVVLSPWLLRNYLVCGTPLGTAGFAMLEGTEFFPGFQLAQSLHPDLSVAGQIKPYLHKFWPNFGDILEHDWPLLGGSWVAMLFFTGLLLPFRGQPVRRLRYFLLMCLGLFSVVQALGRTQWAIQSPVVNGENLLVLVVPLVLMYGTVCFFTFLAQWEIPQPEYQVIMRYSTIGVFVLLMCLPAVGKRFASKANPLAYPPYYPPEIQKTAGWMKPGELIMSDVPWAVAWYGDRQCIWLTLNAGDDFYAVNDFLKPVQALYLTSDLLDGRLLTDCLRTPSDSWGNFALKVTTTGARSFPLQMAPPAGLIKSGLFLSDRARWLDGVP
jgi:hypothetical protein